MKNDNLKILPAIARSAVTRQSKPQELIMKTLSLLIVTLLSLFSFAAMAHTGHGEASVFAHNLEHTLWLVSAVVVIVTAFFVLRKRQ